MGNSNIRIGISSSHNVFDLLEGYYEPTEYEKIYNKMYELTQDHEVSADVASWSELATVGENEIIGEKYELPERTIFVINDEKMYETKREMSKGW